MRRYVTYATFGAVGPPCGVAPLQDREEHHHVAFRAVPYHVLSHTTANCCRNMRLAEACWDEAVAIRRNLQGKDAGKQMFSKELEQATRPLRTRLRTHLWRMGTRADMLPRRRLLSRR